MMKLLSCRFNMDTNRVEARFEDGTTLAIDCIAIEDEYGSTPAQRAELDWLLYNKPLEYAQLVLGGELEHYLSLGCDHGRLEDRPLMKNRITAIEYCISYQTDRGQITKPFHWKLPQYFRLLQFAIAEYFLLSIPKLPE